MPKFILAATAGALLLCSGAHAQTPQTDTIDYRVEAFRLFDAAQAQLSLTAESDPNLFTAKITVKPTGTLKHFIAYQSCEFTSRLRWQPEKSRYRTEYFEKHLISKRDYRGVYTFDFEKGIVKGQGFINGKPLEIEEFPLPENGDSYEDLLSLLNNLRHDAYGTLKPGTRLELRTIPTQKQRSFTLDVLDAGREKAPGGPLPDATLVALKLDRKFLGFHIDRFYIWISKDHRPERSMAKNVLAWGDIAVIAKEPVL